MVISIESLEHRLSAAGYRPRSCVVSMLNPDTSPAHGHRVFSRYGVEMLFIGANLTRKHVISLRAAYLGVQTV